MTAEDSSREVSGSDLWRDFHHKFRSLAIEERNELAEQKDCWLRAYCTYKDHPEVLEKDKTDQGPFCLIEKPEYGLWMLSDGISENFRERFELLAMRAGIALGTSQGTLTLEFWLHRLYGNLRESESRELFAADEKGGMILRVCEASATFCSRLEKKALEAPVLHLHHEVKRGKGEGKRAKVAKRQELGEREPEVWAKLERRGDFIVLAEPSNDTTTQMRRDYHQLYWNVRQFNQWVSQKRENEKHPTLEEAKTVFGGTILVGDANRVPYLTDQELEGLITHGQTPSSFAESIVAKRWGFTPATGKTYLRRKPNCKRAID